MGVRVQGGDGMPKFVRDGKTMYNLDHLVRVEIDGEIVKRDDYLNIPRQDWPVADPGGEDVVVKRATRELSGVFLKSVLGNAPGNSVDDWLAAQKALFERYTGGVRGG